MIKALRIAIIILSTGLTYTHAKGQVMIELSDRGFSYVIDQAVKTIDDSFKDYNFFSEAESQSSQVR